MHATLPLLKITDFPALRRKRVETLQVNLGYTCNQSCVHCHVNAGPHRTERWTAPRSTRCSRCSRPTDIQTIDLTGGAPELNREFRHLVREARGIGSSACT